MTKALAEGILALEFPEADIVRVDELNSLANEGAPIEDEQMELETLVNLASYRFDSASPIASTIRRV